MGGKKFEKKKTKKAQTSRSLGREHVRRRSG
jgi:hypothetical protein